MKYDLAKAHADYRGLIPPIIDTLLAKYPRAALREVYVGDPRNERDQSMGYFDQDNDKIWLNSFWLGKPLKVLREAALSPPHFHGKMVEEPRHVLCHEVMHAVEYGMGFRQMNARIERVWNEVTMDPSTAPADYACVNPTEFFAELGACVEMGLATEDQTAWFRYCMGDD